jgi:DNA-binding transcriptional MocR family regulator
MRIETTLPDPRARQLAELADELHMSKSAVIEEALALLFTGLVEARRGRRVAIIDAESQRVISQLATPALSQVEWASRREPVTVSEGVASPPKATAALRKAMRPARHPRNG